MSCVLFVCTRLLNIEKEARQKLFTKAGRASGAFLGCYLIWQQAFVTHVYMTTQLEVTATSRLVAICGVLPDDHITKCKY